MAQRIFVECRSNHDLISVANLACENLLGRKFDPEKDFIRYLGDFTEKSKPTKVRVLVDCDCDKHESVTKIDLKCYNVTSNNDQM
jgi:hypothetical protein